MICALILLFLIFSKAYVEEPVKAVIYSATLWTLYLYAVTEILSIFSSVRFIPLLITWLLFDIVLLVFLILKSDPKSNKATTSANKATSITKTPIKDIRTKKLSNASVIRAIMFISLSIMMLYMACRIVPYNWDSMTYHCARIANWAHNGSVAHYAASIMRQVCSPTLAEFVNLNLYVLMNKNDVLFNCVQCVSYLISVYLIYKIAEKIGCDDKGAMFASILFATSPTCFAEALSTQVDEFATLWMPCYTYMILEIIYDKTKLQMNRSTFFKMMISSLGIAFGYLTKPTVIIAMMIFTIWMVVVVIARKNQIKTITTWIISVPIMSLVIILPELVRNLITFNAISPDRAGKTQIKVQ